jgi:hypothetical protein
VKDKLSGSEMVFGRERFSVGNSFRSGMVFGRVGNGGSGGG